ncbi:unnamed protein product [Oikopleura dioica]|uniref:MARVEL domain-containing protein n=3 Tax=Oikopleura dioica TaxID=34765 RepID=E4WY05_OIKDI|nr:unnamed protein product [Oikopleura dioica]
MNIESLLAEGRFRVLNEPRGFIRIIQWVLAIVAFATCSGYTETLTFTSHCVPAGQDDAVVTDQKIVIKYPFNIAKANPDFHKFDDACETQIPVTLAGDVSPSASWYVFVGVIAFLYCMVALGYYVFIEPTLRENDEIPTYNNVDLIITGVMVFFWLTGASTMAWGKNQLDFILTHGNIVKEAALKDFCETPNKCIVTAATFVKLNASVAFGFLNFFLWLGSLWFVWKEASFFKRVPLAQSPPATA